MRVLFVSPSNHYVMNIFVRRLSNEYLCISFFNIFQFRSPNLLDYFNGICFAHKEHSLSKKSCNAVNRCQENWDWYIGWTEHKPYYWDWCGHASSVGEEARTVS